MRKTTLHTATRIIEDIASAHPMIHGFQEGPMEDIDIVKLGAETYPLLFVEWGNVTFQRGTASYDLVLVLASKPSDSLEDELETNKDLLLYLRDVLNSLFQANDGRSEALPYGYQAYSDINVDSVTCTPFFSRFDNHLTGWMAQLTLVTDNDNDLCQSLQ